MDIRFIRSGREETVRSILAFQAEGESPYWSEALYTFYPRLSGARDLTGGERRVFLTRELHSLYGELQDTLEEKCALYAAHWAEHRVQVTEALSDAFGLDCGVLFNALLCRVSLNPISPRFLEEHAFEVFFRNSPSGALGLSLHEIIHFLWFHLWHRLFGDDYGEYERPSLKWVLSEMVVEPIMSDPRLASLNPYYPGCVYDYFFDLSICGRPILDSLAELYREADMPSFMEQSYAYCLAHEAEIRAHIAAAEGA